LLIAAAKGELGGKTVEIDEQYAVTVVQVSAGYPGDFEKGKRIDGLQHEGSGIVFHAGTRRSQEGILSDGGRVLAITGRGHSLKEAREAAYEKVRQINWDGLYFRNDIGLDLMNYHS